ncbi:MAG TPA: hypothetical protein VLC06_04775 [Polyangia bacterium]|jgi:hypothetical protein|nr:hypothetical protein [Polyangia bacterium]
MKSLVVAGALLVAVVLVGCGGSTRTLTATDVSNIPPGSAVGTTLSGTYLVVSGSIDDCDCRVGSCSEFHAEIGVTYTIVEQDGALSITDSGDDTGTPLLGGVDADDSFSAGGVAQVPAYLGQGVIYALEEGKFSVSGGAPTGVSFSIDETVKTTIGGTTSDCDIHGSSSAEYEGP